MSPRRPTAPTTGTSKARAVARPASPTRQPATRQAATRPPASGRVPSRPFPVPAGQAAPAPGGRTRRPVIRPVTVISGVLVVVTLLLAPYVRPWVTQRSQLAEGRRQLAAEQQQVNDLAAERRRWDDPAYVRAQARARLHLVMPGETGYVVVDPQPAASAVTDPRSVAAALPAGSAGQVWYTKVWDSIRNAGDPTTEQARSAGGK